MYKVHQDATLIPVSVISGDYMSGDKKLAAVYASASVDKNGATHLSLVNIDASKEQEITVKVGGSKSYKSVGGRILTSAKLQDYNSFEKPEAIKPVNFSGAKLSNGTLTVKLPAHSVAVLELK
jgi:alpha-L-arabinofuranosidase